jgi:hypothetical protein
VLRRPLRELQGGLHVAPVGVAELRRGHRFGSMEARLGPRYQELFAPGGV